jgi:hypothetical protein
MSQVSSYEELEVMSDSMKVAYKPTKRNYAYLRSKRGSDGLNHTSKADSIISFPVTQIVLVYTELNSAALAEREDANRERWDNLIMTYPEFFQTNTTYKSICQCNESGDAEAFKAAQGFYVYFKGEEPKVTEAPPPPAPAKTEEPPSPSKPAKTPEPPAVAKTSPPAEKPAPAKETPSQPAAVAPKENPPAPEKQPEQEPVAASKPQQEESSGDDMAPVKESPRAGKKSGVAKPKRSKDKKACRPACYEGGDEDLIAFFKQNITLSKKQKRKGKNLMAVIKLQLHFDGSIKKETVTGENETLNQQVESAVKSMSPWNPAVKNGVAIKSEVKITLKFDRETKSMKPFEVLVTPHPAPKCKCASDAEIFGN